MAPIDEIVLVCPNCHSDEWRAASVVYQEGLSVTGSRTNGSMLGIARIGMRSGQCALGGGLYRGKTHGAEQTLLSSMAAPPRKRTRLFNALALLSGFFIWVAANGDVRNGFDTGTVTCSFIALFLVTVLIIVHVRQKKAYDMSLQIYEKTCICQRCGTFYTR